MRMVGPSAKDAFHLDTRVFQDQIRRHLAQTSRQLDKATNARLFYWLLRAFAILPPKDPKAERARIKQYLNATAATRLEVATKGRRKGKFVARKISKQFTRAHIIIQSKQRKAGMKGFYGAKMEAAYQSFMRRSVASVGYAKSALVKAMKQLNGHFTQFGKKSTKGKDVPPNKALAEIAADYGLALGGNIGVHRGAKSSVRRATPGMSPVASANLSMGVDDDQYSKVFGMQNAAFHRAMMDEVTAIQRTVADVVQTSVDEQFNK